MIRRPPRSTRTDTLFPYTTLFRSLAGQVRNTRVHSYNKTRYAAKEKGRAACPPFTRSTHADQGSEVKRAFVDSQRRFLHGFRQGRVRLANACDVFGCASDLHARSEERRVGTECVSKCRSRGSPDH